MKEGNGGGLDFIVMVVTVMASTIVFFASGYVDVGVYEQ